MATLINRHLGTMDLEVDWKQVGCNEIFGKCVLPIMELQQLRHELFLTIEGPDLENVRTAVNECLSTAELAGMLAGITAAFTPIGLIGALEVAKNVFLAAFSACIGSKIPEFAGMINAKFPDHSHWVKKA